MAALDSNEASVSGDYIAHTEGAKLSTSLFQDSHIKSLRLINTLSYAFTAITVLSTVPTYFANYEYNNGNYTEWMTDQTLLSVAPSTQFIWYLLFILQGLFIVAAFLPSLQFSELLGYTFLASNNHNSSKNDNSSNKSGRGGAVIELRRSTLRDYTNTSVVVQYPALCASTLLMMYSAKLKFMTLAFVGSFISTYLLVNITKFQAVATAAAAARSSEGDANSNSDTATFKSEIITYICLKLPFELYTGYALALTIMFFNIIIHKLFGSTVLSVILAIVSLVMMLIVGCYVTWNKGMFGLNYGFGVGLIWYMVSSCGIVCYFSMCARNLVNVNAIVHMFLF